MTRSCSLAHERQGSDSHHHGLIVSLSCNLWCSCL